MCLLVEIIKPVTYMDGMTSAVVIPLINPIIIIIILNGWSNTPIPALNIKIKLNKFDLMHKAFVLVMTWQFGPI